MEYASALEWTDDEDADVPRVMAQAAAIVCLVALLPILFIMRLADRDKEGFSVSLASRAALSFFRHASFQSAAVSPPSLNYPCRAAHTVTAIPIASSTIHVPVSCCTVAHTTPFLDTCIAHHHFSTLAL